MTTSVELPTIGILGAGKLGITLAKLARRAGYEVMVAASSDPIAIELTVATLAPGATAHTASEVARQADIVILALPLSKFRQLPSSALAGKLVVDAMNYWWEVDGPRHAILPNDQSSSEAVQAFLANSRVVKSFSHMGYHHLHDYAQPNQSTNRRAIAIAGNDAADIQIVAQLVDWLGFDPLVIGDLAAGRQLEAGHPAFGANLPAGELRQLLTAGPISEPET